MTEDDRAATPQSTIPPDDPRRTLTIIHPDSPTARHVSIAGGSYTILVSGEESGGRYCLIDMYVPPGGGPPPHRHDFEEMFTLLEGELAFTFRGETSTAPAGTTVNIPANAPHSFKNVSDKPARMLCTCAPAGQEALFMALGDPISSRTAPAPELSPEEIADRRKKLGSLVARYRTELL